MKARTMNYRSVLNKVLLLIPVALVAPLLAVATPACGTLTPTNPVSFTDKPPSLAHPFDATFTCTGVTFTPSFVGGGNEFVLLTSSTQFSISTDAPGFLGLPDTNIVFTGTTPTHEIITFQVADGPVPDRRPCQWYQNPAACCFSVPAYS